jgi:L-ascorbate metabolism protein UlaG (beta-lactamase superfamily)
VSHNHPDHLDEEVIRSVNNKATWIVPLGVRKYLARHGIHNIIEIDWWDRVRISSKDNNVYEIACTPSMHWSGRTLFDSNQSLWCSFLLLKNDKPIVYHAGDTGYVNDLFTKIAERYGPGVKLAMLPMGQYCPQWHQKPRHINPEECFKIMNDLQAKKMVGIHWGTFVLSSEYFLEPKVRLEALTKNYKRQNDVFAPHFGKTYILDISKDDEPDKGFVEVRNGKSVVVK